MATSGSATFGRLSDSQYKNSWEQIFDPVESVSFSSPSITMERGDSVQLAATVLPETANPAVTFSSSNTGIIDVESDGYLYVKKSGSVTVTATAVNNMTATCTVYGYRKDTLSSHKDLFGITPDNTDADFAEYIAGYIFDTPESGDALIYSGTDNSYSALIYDNGWTPITGVSFINIKTLCETNTVCVLGTSENEETTGVAVYHSDDSVSCYTSLNSAIDDVINNAESGCTIKLFRDAIIGAKEITTDVTIDLNNCVIRPNHSNSIFTITNGGSLTIVDTATEKTPKYFKKSTLDSMETGVSNYWKYTEYSTTPNFVTGGLITGADAPAILVTNGTFTMKSGNLAGNNAIGVSSPIDELRTSGGAINASTNGVINIEGGTIAYCGAYLQGGAISMGHDTMSYSETRAHINISNATFKYCDAWTAGEYGYGGAISQGHNCDMVVKDTTFENCTSNSNLYGGGAIDTCMHSNTVLENVYISNCSAPNGDGGGIHSESGGPEDYGNHLSMKNVTIENCTAKREGGGLHAWHPITVSGNISVLNNSLNNGTVSNVYLCEDMLTVDGELTGNGQMGITTKVSKPTDNNDVVFTTNATQADIASYFTSDENYYVKKTADGQVCLSTTEPTSFVCAVTNVTYTPSADTHKEFVITVKGRATMVQFVLSSGSTVTAVRGNDNVSIVSYNEAGEEVGSTARNLAYEIWTFNTNMIPEGTVKARGKFVNPENRSVDWEAPADEPGLYSFYVETIGYIYDTYNATPDEGSRVRSVTYEPLTSKTTAFTVTVLGRPDMLQFIRPSGTTSSFARNNKNVTIKCYNAADEEVAADSKEVAYEIWTINSGMSAANNIRVRGKFVPPYQVKAYWEAPVTDESLYSFDFVK